MGQIERIGGSGGQAAKSLQVTTDLQRRADQLEQYRDRLGDAVRPPTWLDKMRRKAARSLPLGSDLKARIEQTPIDLLKAGLRDTILELYSDMGSILKEGRERTHFHNEFGELIQSAQENPEDHEAVADLRERMRSRAEQELGIRRDAETEELLAELRQTQTPEQQQAAREKMLFEARQLHDLSGPTIEALETVLFASASTFDSLMTQYAGVSELGDALNLLHKTGGDLVRGTQLGITSKNTVEGEIELALEAAYLARDAQILARELDTTVNPKRLQEIGQRAQGLKQPNDGESPQPAAKKEEKK